jgi:trans-aconitate 2-methyltransferase
LSSADFYDAFSAHQVRVGINERHRAIRQWLKRFGLVPGMDVLELGCGVGTLTELIADTLGDTGHLLGVDLSPRSIELAQSRLATRRNVELLTADIVQLKLDRTFDVVVLADVIEHIPLEHHAELFANVRRWVRDTGWVLVHIPNPLFLEWCHRNRPDLLQQIDQPISTETLVANTQPNELYLSYLNTYSIWVQEGDYQVIVLKPRPEDAEFHISAGSSLREKLAHLARRKLKA